MFEVTFSDQSMSMLNRLDIMIQMPIIERFSNLTSKELSAGSDDVGKFERGGKTYYRLRAGEYRIYFEVINDSRLLSHYIIHKHTLADFIFRFKLPYHEETLVEQNQSFWQYVESLTSRQQERLPDGQSEHPGKHPGNV
ncbi:type II toxin-antitoxin system RelE family toxin [Cerasicoccus fimbriatus]|uniref:type II toxin-antitoxin system RelE family toxin n=1 Tax=Cerasicoccus fimbriatus TaxID=3014554 RepID=UPI0022B5C8F6|nr:cytotoxic translational repressor of toxin-antitoxin stability system [Cerasicoccus sp. TK19100]